MGWQTPQRFWRHAVIDDRHVARAFPPAAMERIEQAIEAGEATHRGQVGVAIEAALPLTRVLRDVRPRERAIEVFGSMRIWDTEENNGVLLYLLLADHDVEIVADRAIHRRVGEAAWEAICQRMEAAFRDARFAEGVETGIREISALLAEHFPGDAGNLDELSNKPLVL